MVGEITCSGTITAYWLEVLPVWFSPRSSRPVSGPRNVPYCALKYVEKVKKNNTYTVVLNCVKYFKVFELVLSVVVFLRGT